MTDINEDQTTVEPQDTGQEEGGWINEEGTDAFLAQMVALANAGYSIPVTLSTGGALVTGHICSGRQYMISSKEALTAGWQDIPDVVSKVFDDWIKQYEVESPHTISFIHLKDAHLYVDGRNQIPSNGNFLWRGRLSEVSGWNLGALQQG